MAAFKVSSSVLNSNQYNKITIVITAPKPRPRSIVPEIVSAYYNVVENEIYVLFEECIGLVYVEICDKSGLYIESKIVDTSLELSHIFTSPESNGEYVLKITSSDYNGIGYFEVNR